MKNAYKITKFAKSQGFDLVGFTDVEPSKEAYKNYLSWLEKNFNADMQYMSREDAVTKRKSAANLLKNAKSVICLAINYYHDQPPLPKGHGRIARYAYGRDYHKILKSKLKKIEAFLQENFKTTAGQNPKTLSYTDTGPILERTLAEQAGLGFIGHNSCLITKEFGSWVLLSEIITDLEVQNTTIDGKSQNPLTCKSLHMEESQSVNVVNLSCGACTRCIDACPTKAITLDPNTGRTQIDATKCISYLTIEHKGQITPELTKKIRQTHRIFGCDICQEVCPHNCRAKLTNHKEFLDPKIAGDSLDLAKLKNLKTDDQYLKAFAGSPLMRAKLHKRLASKRLAKTKLT